MQCVSTLFNILYVNGYMRVKKNWNCLVIKSFELRNKSPAKIFWIGDKDGSILFILHTLQLVKRKNKITITNY